MTRHMHQRLAVRRRWLLALGWMSAAMSWVACGASLDDYVAAEDRAYSFKKVKQYRGDAGTMYVLDMASQMWLGEADVDRVLWRHWLEVYVPDRVEHETALLMIGGGDSEQGPPGEANATLAATALESRSVTAYLRNVPNQPLTFFADPERRRRSEDGILAFALSQYAQHRRPEWLPLFPMVKSAVRAMDTITAFCRGLTERPAAVTTFVVSGYSKRGWTSWLTAAVDKRVVGVVPTVIDMLNTKKSMQHQYRTYGEYAEAVHDYVENGVLSDIDTPEMDAVLAQIDPFSYRDRYTMPKLVLNSAGDQFFCPDSWRLYWDELPGPKALRYVPNTDHSLDESARETLRSFYASVLAGEGLPTFSWRVETPGRIRVRCVTPPLRVLKWEATNPTSRDFRVATVGRTWRSEELGAGPDGSFVAEQSEPATGWSAFLVEVTFADPVRRGKEMRFSSGIGIVPDRLPYSTEAGPRLE